MPDLVRPLRVRVVGVSHAPGYPRNLTDLAPRLHHDGHVALELHRDVDNADDLNATSVRLHGAHLGWLPRDVAAQVAPLIDAGTDLVALAWRVAVDLDHRDRPGLDIVVAPSAHEERLRALLAQRQEAHSG